MWLWETDSSIPNNFPCWRSRDKVVFLKNLRIIRQQTHTMFNNSLLNHCQINNKTSIYNKTNSIWLIIVCNHELSQNGFEIVIWSRSHVITFAKFKEWRTIISGYLAMSQISGIAHVMRLAMYNGNVKKNYI